jgi:hypothetical protein
MIEDIKLKLGIVTKDRNKEGARQAYPYGV